jgi:hypothetical protein
LERDKVRFVGVAVLAMAGLLLVVSFATFDGRGTFFGPPLGADFAGFYAAGTLLNEYPPDRLYDFDLQDEVYHRVLPGTPPEEQLPCLYPPFFAVLFRPLATPPYSWAYAAWLAVSVALSVAALALMRQGLAGATRIEWFTILVLALSFEPLVMECWLGGQTSAFGLFAIALALHHDRRGQPVRSGLALALCLYKPTLLLMVLPMMAAARRGRTLAGFALGVLGLGALSLLAVGWQGCLEYVQLFAGFAQRSVGGQSGFSTRTWKFVDLSSFLNMLFGGPSLPLRLLLLTCFAIVLPFLGRAWWGLDRGGEGHRKVVWACTLTATLVLNVYVGVYDVSIVVLGVLLTTDVLYKSSAATGGLPATWKWLLVLLYVVPWVSQHVAKATGFQPLTLVLAAVGTYQFLLARRTK